MSRSCANIYAVKHNLLFIVARGIWCLIPNSATMSGVDKYRKKPITRTVPAFSIESRQRNTKIMEPPKVDQRKIK